MFGQCMYVLGTYTQNSPSQHMAMAITTIHPTTPNNPLHGNAKPPNPLLNLIQRRSSKRSPEEHASVFLLPKPLWQGRHGSRAVCTGWCAVGGQWRWRWC